MRRSIAAIALAAASVGIAAGCSSGTTTVHPAAASSTPASPPASTSCPGINCTSPSSSATAPLTGPVGTTFTVPDYGQSGIDGTYKITLQQVAEPARLDPRGATLTTGASHAAALKFLIQEVTGTSSFDASYGVQATGSDGEVFSAGGTAIDPNFYLSSSATNLMAGEHGTWWGEVDLPAGVHVKAVRYLDETVYTPQDALNPVTWTVPVAATHAAQPASQPGQSQAPAASQPASQAPATQPAAPATPAGYLGNVFGGGTGNPCNFASGYQLGACNPTGETQSQYIANPGGPAPGTSTNSQGCYYVKMGEGYCPSTGKYIPMQDPNQP
jgi:hypothetical protein